MSLRPSARFVAAVLAPVLSIAGVAFVAAPAADASVSAKISSFPYTQNWSGLAASGTGSAWSDFPGVEGFTTGTSIAAANLANTTDVGTLTAEGTLTSALTIRTAATMPNTDSNGGILAYPNVANKTVALSATGTLTTPELVFHLDTTGQSGLGIRYDIQDLDSSSDNQPTRVAVQYRVGTSGAYTNVPDGYIDDATVASNSSLVTTSVTAPLPAAVDGQPDVYVRLLTLDNASGSNEHIGIDNITIETGGITATMAPSVLPIANQSWTQLTAITDLPVAARRGTVDVTGLPAGVSYANGTISGTPADAGSGTATVTVSGTESRTATTTFDWTVATPAPATHLLISQLFGDGGFTGAAFKNDYVVLYNPTASPVSLAGTSLAAYQYNRTANSLPLWVETLSGTVPAGGHFLISGAADAIGAGQDLPKPDFVGGDDINYFDGYVALLTTTTPLALPLGNTSANANIIDGLGYGGPAANTFEGAPEGTGALALNEAYRKIEYFDTNNNSADFGRRALAPVNAAGETFPELKLSRPGDASVIVNQPIDPIDLTSSGGVGTRTYDLTTSTPDITVNPTSGTISGTPTVSGDHTMTARVTDGSGHTTTKSFVMHVGTFAVGNPGEQIWDLATPVDLAIEAVDGEGHTNHFSYAVTGGNLPPGVALDSETGHFSGTPTAGQAKAPLTVTVTNTDDSTTSDVTFDLTVITDLKSIAELQGTGARSPYADPDHNFVKGAETVTTKGVITGFYDAGFDADGSASCGLCGFYLQTPNPSGDATAGASDAIFVYKAAGFSGAGLAVGDTVKVSGRVSEFDGRTSGTPDTSRESLTELNATTVNEVASMGAVTPQPSLPATYADREAHEGELFAPTDVVITDTYNFEPSGELGLAAATGGVPLQQPGQSCRDGDTGCITAAQTFIKNHGYFLDDGTDTAFVQPLFNGSSYFDPSKSKNSDIPLPFVDKTHSARLGAKVTFPHGAPLDFRVPPSGGKGKWYLQPPRPVLASHAPAGEHGTPDLGTDVVEIENTRADNAQPADVGGNMRFATYNVENFFSVPATEFENDNPWLDSSGPGCEYDYDRAHNPITIFQCTSPTAIPSAWDPVTSAVTAYNPGLTSAPRGAARQEDLARQTAKIVTAINKLGADVVALEEIGNPNKLKRGITTSPLTPDPSKADGGQGTAIQWRDETVAFLVDHLNAGLPADSPELWAWAPSPQESTDATAVAGMCSTTQANGQPVDGPAHLAGTCSWASGQDVIRSAFIYKKARVVPVGPGDLDLPGSSAPTPSPFDNAREPFAQYFKQVGDRNDEGFALIVNHFKSKGDSDPSATGGNANDPLHGAFNQARVDQAHELVRFANEFAGTWGTDKVFLLGDFNAYGGEDPIHAILDDPGDGLDFQETHSDDPKDTSYVFSTDVDGLKYGGAGSLDHIFASAGARALQPHTDVWEINANEPDIYDYGRYNTNATDFFDGGTPWRGSDHNPEIVGLTLPTKSPADQVHEVQIIGTNDFHGRLTASTSDGGAAQLTSAVKYLKSIYGPANSIFVSAGDNIGASTFESFIQQDKPTLEALNEAGLEISALGNHEFDRGYEDILNRQMKPHDGVTNPFGASNGTRQADGDGLNWDYLSANVRYHADPDGTGPIQAGDPIVAPTQLKTINGQKIGFIGAVTQDLPGLVKPTGLSNIDVQPVVDTVNAAADDLSADGADIIVLLMHEGAPSTDCSTMRDPGNNFSTILNGLSPKIDTVLSGHTHLEYSCSFPVDAWAADANHPIKTRPVLQAGSYGVALDQVVYSFNAAGEPVDVMSNNVGVKGPGSALFSFGEDPATKDIITAAVNAAEGPGNQVLGRIGDPFSRAKLSDGVTENRGGESTLGNMVAEIQRWASPVTAEMAPAQIAFMNPGGLRADLKGSPADTPYPRDVTYREGASVQPFANDLVNMDLTGAQIQAILEQQWQRDADGHVPSRPFLRLGTSKGFTYTYTEANDPATGAKLGHVTGMWLNGTPVSPFVTYSVTVNEFLAGGGDNFRAFKDGADKRDTGKTDLQAQVEYLAANAPAGGAPLPVDYGQHAVKVTFPADAPAAYRPGDQVSFSLSSLDMTGTAESIADAQDNTLAVTINGTTVGDPIAVQHQASRTSPFDEYGTASVSFALPAEVTAGGLNLHLVGSTTDTNVIVPITVALNSFITTPTPTISGTPQVGQTLTAHEGTWDPEQDGFTYQWLADGTPIDGATTNAYTPAGADATKTITVAVTGNKAGYTSVTKTSDATAAVAPGTLTTDTPTIDDTTPTVGQTLTATGGTWGPAPVALTYQWKVDGAAVGTGSTYAVAAADAGKPVTVTATGTKTGYTAANATSVPTTAVAKADLTPVTPTITGTSTVGQTLTATAGVWTPAVDQLDYAWKANGTPIAGATSATYLIEAAHAGETITVTVTGHKAGYNDAEATADPTTAVAPGTLTPGTPTIDDTTPTFGQTLTASPGTWSPAPITPSYQWFANGVAISGATSETFTTTADEVNKQLSVLVTAAKPGYVSAQATSPATSPMAPLTLTSSGSAAISDATPEVGQIVVATPPAFGPAPVTITYQWLANGVPLAGATGSSLTIADALVGKTLSVAVTANKPGYAQTVVTSPATAQVASPQAPANLVTQLAQPTITAIGTTQVYGKSATMHVVITTTGVTATGTVSLSAGAVQLGSATLSSDGTANVPIAARKLAPRGLAYPVSIHYSGNAAVATGDGLGSLKVVKGSVIVTAKAKTTLLKVNRTRGSVTVTVANADRVKATGYVKLQVGAQVLRAELVQGSATFRLRPLRRAGSLRVAIAYPGSKYLLPGRTSFQVTAQR